MAHGGDRRGSVAANARVVSAIRVSAFGKTDIGAERADVFRRMRLWPLGWSETSAYVEGENALAQYPRRGAGRDRRIQVKRLRSVALVADRRIQCGEYPVRPGKIIGG